MSYAATLKRPSGFSDYELPEEPVTILGFVHGIANEMQDQRLGPQPLAIVAKGFKLHAVPLSWLTLASVPKATAF